MTKLRLALGGAAVAAAFVLPAAPAHASCINIVTTPEECAKQALAQLVGPIETCIPFYTFDICPPPVSS